MTDTDKVLIPVTLNAAKKFVGPSVEKGQPISYPLHNLEELLSWKANDPNDRGQIFSVGLFSHTSKYLNDDKPRTLVCHDMKGGYLEDRFVQGLWNQNCYYMKYWNMVDIFVYFSHHFITIPPVTWINACHRNGITILGTFITESEDGYKRCSLILENERMWKLVAEQMAALARFYHFDGWLINIENTVDTDKVPALIKFVGYLTSLMKSVDANALVIWYDAVTVQGKLEWQNQLNHLNKCFYDVCDGIFLNYTWDESDLEKSSVVARCGSSVYVGVDVFGRGCYGGGGFNSSIAVQVARRFHLSAAIFAPGWVYQQFGFPRFEEMNNRFWTTLQPHCPSRPMVCPSGFASRFNPGCNYTGLWCFLNGQDTMPHVPAPHMWVSADDQSRGGALELGLCNDPMLCFKLQMKVGGGEATLLVPSTCSCSFVLQTDKGDMKPGPGSFKPLPLHDDVMVIYYLSQSSFTVSGIVVRELEGKEKTRIAFIGLYPKLISSHHGAMTSSSTMTCVDCDWRKDPDNDEVFLFGGTLCFLEAPRSTASSSVCCVVKSHQSEEKRSLGVAICKAFRVSNLQLPNPKYLGPNCSVTFIVTHLSELGLELGESRLIVEYAENLRVDSEP